MHRMRGIPGGGGSAMGSATVLRPPIGMPMIPARLMLEMQKRARDAAMEPLDIVLVAERYILAAGVTVPWGRVVAIVCEQEEHGSDTSVPLVTGVANLLQVVGDDTLLVVDGDRGTVLVEPDSVSVAAYQAERERISPRRRFYLDFEHQPAATSDGRQIHVAATVNGPEEASVAVEGGADSLFIPADSGFFDQSQNEPAQTNHLLELGRAASGKPIVVSADLGVLSASALLKASLRAEYTLALPGGAGAAVLAAARADIEEARIDLMEQEVDFGDIRLAATIGWGEELPDDLTDYLVGRLFMMSTDFPQDDRLIDWIDETISTARAIVIPVIADLGPMGEAMLPKLIGLGAAGIIVPAQSITACKEAIRKLDSYECRAQLRC